MAVSIVFLDRDTLPARIALPAPAFAHHWQEYPATSPEQVVPRLQDATMAIVNKVRIGEAELAALPQLRLIAVAATGTDNVDLEAATKAGVCVMNTPGQNANAVAELALGMMVYAVRNFYNGTSGTELDRKSVV